MTMGDLEILMTLVHRLVNGYEITIEHDNRYLIEKTTIRVEPRKKE
jgi:hypothetical protein